MERELSEPRLPGVERVSCAEDTDLVVREEPLLIEVAGERVLTMRTPGDDLDLALGFLLAEGIVASPDAVEGLELLPAGRGAACPTAKVVLRPGAEPGPIARERLTRAHAVRPSCGLCGLASAEGLTRHLSPLAPGGPRWTLEGLAALSTRMRAGQRLFAATGGTHAAALFGPDEACWALREDVGRHNALDKALGAAVRSGRDLSQATLLLSGRAGYELVLKALRLGVPVVASISAPTSLAVALAEEHGQTLVAFLRGRGGRVYADEDRILPAGRSG